MHCSDCNVEIIERWDQSSEGRKVNNSRSKYEQTNKKRKGFWYV
jgi:hypothetical protein